MAPPISPFPHQSFRAFGTPGPGNYTMQGGVGETSWMTGHGFSQASNPSGFSRWSEEKIAAMQVRLSRKLGPEYVTQRPGPSGGPKLSYIEGWKVINLANEVFGFNGWSSTITSLTTDFIDVNEQGRVTANVTAIVRITLQDGAWHEDVGCGQSENVRGKTQALDKAKKEAVTDATKRALKSFGNVLGNCLYDKEYTKEVVRMKVPPAKFNTSNLERRPEFTEAGAPGPGPSTSRATTATAVPTHMSNAPKQPIPAVPARDMPAVAPLRNMTETPEAPDSPLLDINELDDDVFMDESFDGELLAAQSDFFQEERNPGQTRPVQSVPPRQPQQQHPPAVRSNVAQVETPTYQHRHRPDMPPPTSMGRANFARSVSDPAKKVVPGPQNTGRDQAEQRHNQAQRSSGDTTETAESDSHRVKMEAAATERPTSTTGQSARALAISSALAAQNTHQHTSPAHHTPPLPRAESPRIPDGGVAHVAARATGHMSARAAALGLEREGTPDRDYQGFTSARRFKRTRSTDEKNGSPTKGGASVSPTKMGGEMDVNGGNSPGGVEQRPPGPRRVLGELSIERAVENDWTKRARAA